MAVTKRQLAESYIIEYIGKLLPEDAKITSNQQIYIDLFASMSDKQFSDFMKSLSDGSSRLAIIAPNLAKSKLSVERNLKIAKELGHNFFERIWMSTDENSPAYLSNVPYMIVDLPLRRQAQLLVKKISIPEDNKSVDDLSGQPTGKSKGSKISYPETQILASMGANSCLEELLKIRGGDQGGFNASNESISRTGGFSLKNASAKATGVQSSITLATLLTAMHLKNNLINS